MASGSAISAGHPRVGGEHSGRNARISIHAGSSPRGRGTPGRGGAGRQNARVIPAWAGNTHPHIRTAQMEFGSSPRGRGTLAPSHLKAWWRRVIPAWAGNTPAPTGSTAAKTGHPRVGGEHTLINALKAYGGGSSPRGRGTPRQRDLHVADVRVIPAWAGNTSAAANAVTFWTGHPRVGGEHCS